MMCIRDTPEAQLGGPIAVVQTGDKIVIDARQREINVTLSDDDLAARRAEWKMPPYKTTNGVLGKYIKNDNRMPKGDLAMHKSLRGEFLSRILSLIEQVSCVTTFFFAFLNYLFQ